jgi:hypothetical protein
MERSTAGASCIAAAVQQRDEARRVIDRPRQDRKERQAAEQQEREAKRELELLLNKSAAREESDFYQYRHLAAESLLRATTSRASHCAP